MTFPDDWRYYKTHQITHDTELVDYQVKILVDSGAGSSSGNTVYLGSNCKTDFGDIRFTDDDENEYPYWLESVTGTIAVFWVKIGSIDSDSLIRIYYGNQDAETTSDGDNTFIFFDHFDGSSINSLKWTVEKKGSASAIAQVNGSSILQLSGANGVTSSANLISVLTFAQPFVVEIREQINTTNGAYADTSFGLTTTLQDLDGVGTNYWNTSLGNSYIFTPGYNSNGALFRSPLGLAYVKCGNMSGRIFPAANTYYRNKYLKTSTGIQFIRDGITYGSATDATYTGPFYICLNQGEYGGGSSYAGYRNIDYILVRNYSATEPTHGEWSEEQLTGPQISVNYNPGFVDEILQFSADSGSYTYAWDFGDGETSTDRNVSHSYSGPDTYTVTCVITALDLSASWTKTISLLIQAFEITADPSPGYSDEVVSFSVPDWGESHYWQFGDGYDSYLQNPDHVYSTPGTFDVTCTACDEVASRFITASVSLIILKNRAQLITDFYAKPRYGVLPLSVMFIPEISDTIISTSWDFGDGDTSTVLYPVHEYTNPQSYTVKLTVSDGTNTKTLIKENYVYVASLDIPKAGYTHNLTGNSGLVPATVQFTDASTGTITESEWDFGDGATSTSQNPVHVYARSGYYFVKRIVRNADWEDESLQLFYIRPRLPTIRIHTDITSGLSPLTVSFTPIIIGLYTRLLWDFDDDTTSTDLNPEHTYSVPGTYTVTLTVWNTTVQQYSISTTTTIQVIDPALYPAAAFSADVTTGEVPLTATFSDESSLAESWLWDFGDGTTSTDLNPEHTYSVPGTYTVTLTVTNTYGSDIETKTGYIIAGADPVSAFEVDSDINYLSHEFSFVDRSLYIPSSWLWDFDDGTISTDQNPEHTFSAARSYWVTLTVTNTYGSSTIGRDITVISNGEPLPSFTWSTIQTKAPYVVQFTDTSTGTITSRVWDFGDGETSTDENPEHTYLFSGRYVVSLTVITTTTTVRAVQEIIHD
jgi:PKD repeat protein